MGIIQQLTEGMVKRDLQKEGEALVNKWRQTGLLEGIESERQVSTMAVLLENQAAELLREASAMAAGDVEGFAAVAFPIVRRVFGGLIANSLVSVQPMSLPSGLIFFLDFLHSNTVFDNAADTSIYGGGVIGLQLTGGVDLTGAGAERSFYALNNGYASPTGSATLTAGTMIISGTVGSPGSAAVAGDTGSFTYASLGGSGITYAPPISALVEYDVDLSGSVVQVVTVPGDAELTQLNRNNLIGISPVYAASAADGAGSTSVDPAKARLVRRLTKMVGRTAAEKNSNASRLIPTSTTATTFRLVFEAVGTTTGGQLNDHLTSKTIAITYPIDDAFAAGGAIGSVVGANLWGLEEASNTAGQGPAAGGHGIIAEIDIKVNSIPVLAITKKLKAKWTPELGQDLQAYHNLDAEVELTGILSEQIALEIDQEILNDLVRGATAGTYYWSRRPGYFVKRTDGGLVASTVAAGPDFTGTVSEWYETLVETLNDVSAQIHRKTLRGGANFLVCGPEAANILEFTSGFRASVTADTDTGTVGAVKTGNVSKKWDVYVDPYFPRNVILIGRKGGSFLESGYVYAPYVPLQITPTIFGTEDFVPRKGCMTRYAKKMVRPDMYGLVLIMHMLG